MARRRLRGEGTIYRRPDGRIAVELNTGGRRFGPLYTRDEADAVAMLEELRRRAGVLAPADAANQSVRQYLEWWVGVELPARVVEGTLAQTTLDGYEAKVRLYLIPHIGHVKLRALGVQHVRGLMRAVAAAKWRGKPLSPRTREYIHGVLRAALSTAREYELVDRNVAELVAPPTVVRKKPAPLSPDNADLVLDTVAGDRLEAFWLVPMTVGLRPGEAIGLSWDAVDLDAGTLTVRANLVRVGGQRRLHDTKTHQERTIDLPAFAVEALRAHRRRQREERMAAGPRWLGAEVYDRTGQRRVDVDLVFTDDRGRALRSDWVEDELGRICDRAGVARMTPHKFMRHGGATLMLALGVDVYTVKEILGHSTISTTEIYTQVLAEAKRDAAASMDRRFGRRRGAGGA